VAIRQRFDRTVPVGVQQSHACIGIALDLAFRWMSKRIRCAYRDDSHMRSNGGEECKRRRRFAPMVRYLQKFGCKRRVFFYKSFLDLPLNVARREKPRLSVS
jgi:hypothetical protein